MKKLIYTAFIICGMLTASCSDLLNLESKTAVTNNYLFTTPEGLNTAVTGLYSLARELPGGADNNESNLYIVTMCDFNTDIAILRAGVSTSIGRLNTSFTPSTGDVNKFWKHHYGIIGKANEIIVAAEALGLDDSDVLHAWSEAKLDGSRQRLPNMSVHRLPCGNRIGIQPLRNVKTSLNRRAFTQWKRRPRMYLIAQI